MSNDKLTVERSSGSREHHVVLTCKGPFTIQTLFTFQGVVRELNGSGAVLVDFSQVPYMDSAGLGALVGAFISSRHANRKVVLVGVSERVAALIRMSNLEQFFPMYASRVEAEVALP
ncbi:MAG TPA: STAS domain-containing protein [Candidatus Acidoferrales bacterium]|nr:STAS domain-containing protein [Candidatus Acidoferrales bacterium]